MNFGTILRTLLEERGISQRQLAQELNMATSTVGNYIRGIREPDFDSLCRFADYFSVSTDFLLGHHSPTASDAQTQQVTQIFCSLAPEDRRLWLEQGKLLLRLRRNIPSQDGT